MRYAYYAELRGCHFILIKSYEVVSLYYAELRWENQDRDFK